MAILLCSLTLPGGLLPAQEGKPPGIAAETAGAYNQIKGYVLRAAEKMPAGHYGFRPASGVRSFGDVVTHIADVHYIVCAAVKGEHEAPNSGGAQGKEAVLKALKAAFAYCDPVHEQFDDANAARPVKLFRATRTRNGALALNISHTWSHYGNLVVYLRLKGLTPPTSGE